MDTAWLQHALDKLADGLRKQRWYIPRCGPCHRLMGGAGLPSMALPSRPEIDDQGGIHGLCAGAFGEPHGVVHVDHLGEPFDPKRLAEIRAARTAWAEPIAGHTLIR